MYRYLLAIESSCDETAACIIDHNGVIFADVVYSQVPEHAPFGGVVPELASRHHLGRIGSVVGEAFAKSGLKPNQISAVAVTFGPGLIGSLLVGAQFAKGFAQALGVPLIGIHHIEGHLLAGLASEGFPKPPFIALVAAGGHSALYLCDDQYQITTLGETRDDAAGEAFDKIAKMLGFGYPGGQIIDDLAAKGDGSRYQFPVALKDRRVLDYSFSGLKTAVRLKINEIVSQGEKLEGQVLFDLCASAQTAIVDALLAKAVLACKQHGVKRLVLGGGVAANSLLRQMAQKKALEEELDVFIPAKRYCTDNAAMIAFAARRRLLLGQKSSLAMPVMASIGVGRADASLA